MINNKKLYDTWFKISPGLGLIDMMVFSQIGLYYEQGWKCGLKELQEEINSTKNCLSKATTRWLNKKFIKKVYDKDDTRRHYYVPTAKMKLRQGKLY